MLTAASCLVANTIDYVQAGAQSAGLGVLTYIKICKVGRLCAGYVNYAICFVYCINAFAHSANSPRY